MGAISNNTFLKTHFQQAKKTLACNIKATNNTCNLSYYK